MASWLSPKELVEVGQMKRRGKGVLDRRNSPCQSPKGKNKRAGPDSWRQGQEGSMVCSLVGIKGDLDPGLGLALLEMPMAELI